MKTRKTAGTSVELSLSRYCGSCDVITGVALEDERLRSELNLPGPQNDTRRLAVRSLRGSSLRDFRRGRWPRERVFHAHETAADLVRAFPEAWEKYLTFTIVRNPWDYVVSRLFWERYRSGVPELSVDDVLSAWSPRQNWESITLDGRLAVDHVCRYESLTSDLTMLLNRLGIEFDGWLPRAKSSTGRGSVHYRDVLQPRHVELVAEICADEIRQFGYKY